MCLFISWDAVLHKCLVAALKSAQQWRGKSTKYKLITYWRPGSLRWNWDPPAVVICCTKLSWSLLMRVPLALRYTIPSGWQSDTIHKAVELQREALNLLILISSCKPVPRCYSQMVHLRISFMSTQPLLHHSDFLKIYRSRFQILVHCVFLCTY